MRSSVAWRTKPRIQQSNPERKRRSQRSALLASARCCCRLQAREQLRRPQKRNGRSLLDLWRASGRLANASASRLILPQKGRRLHASAAKHAEVEESSRGLQRNGKGWPPELLTKMMTAVG